ncbi:DcaP family trimeric outer membrane transporter [Flammeovirga agarivorans]|uniref:Porin n=1 Tax=Flammeovirga agarivorans TaxID=2726742 RepID=A0A7X8SKH4_9BACT|nr:DcaP family trimeric outer membrane transporter [Flammeovirga agarivorans]NLR91807.1 porin [Flammeovirga agarivorans]
MKYYTTLFLAFFSCSLFAQESDNLSTPNTTFKFGGYVKADFLFTNFHNGELPRTSPMRDIHFPAQIPVGEEDSFKDTDFHVKESRFNFDVKTTKLGKEIHGFLELDFMLSGQGNENVSNSYAPRLRHFYFEWDRMLFGQTWTNFMVVVIPNDLDFSGAPEGIVFVRQPQIRYKYKTWSFSIENPNTTITTNDVTNIATANSYIPDITAKKKFPLKKGFVSVAGIVRTLFSSQPEDYKSFGFGITSGGLIKVGEKGDDFRFMATYGNGLGRYIALGFLSAGYDNDTSLENISSINGYVAYNHYWSKVLSSSFNVSGLTSDNPSNINPQANKVAYSASVNLKYEPIKEMLLGIEFNYGYRELVDNTSGAFSRIQLAARYKFGYHNSETSEKYIK